MSVLNDIVLTEAPSFWRSIVHSIFVLRKTGSDISKFISSQFTISFLRVHYFSIMNSRVEMHEFKIWNSWMQLMKVFFVYSLLVSDVTTVYKVELQMQLKFKTREFVKPRYWNFDEKWSWNREFVKLKKWHREFVK